MTKQVTYNRRRLQLSAPFALAGEGILYFLLHFSHDIDIMVINITVDRGLSLIKPWTEASF